MTYLHQTEVVVEFDPTMYSVMEGMNVQLTVVLRSPSAIAVTVDFQTVDGTANCKWVWSQCKWVWLAHLLNISPIVHQCICFGITL